MAGTLCLLAMIGFIISGIELLTNHPNQYILAVGSALFSVFLYVLFWNGRYEQLSDQGGIGVFINLLIIVWLLVNSN